MKITLDQAESLKRKLKRRIDQDGQTPELIASEIQDELGGGSQAYLCVNSRTIRRYHEEMSAEQLVALRSSYPAKLLKALSLIGTGSRQYLDLRNQARKFFGIGGAMYSYQDLDRLVGTYDMYRPYWVEVGSPDFMRSYVRIKKHGKHYLFTELQNWPDKKIFEISVGYLFPSGSCIVALCKSRSGKHIKFLSIAPSQPSKLIVDKLDRFSGSLIATSDVLPHPGHGFCCIRNSESNRTSNIIKKEVMTKKLEIYHHIMLNQVHSEMDIDEFLYFKQKDNS